MQERQVTGWVGWIYFAALMMTLGGGLQFMAGLAGLFNSDFFVVTSDHLIMLDYTAWGWINIVMGLVIFFAGLALIGGKTWARMVALLLTVLGALTHLSFINAYPLWGIIALIIDGLVIYALVAHGDELRQ